MNTTFWYFHFLKNEYSGIFVKEKKSVDSTIIDLSHQRTLLLFVGGCHKKKSKEKDKAENDIKQKNR